MCYTFITILVTWNVNKTCLLKIAVLIVFRTHWAQRCNLVLSPSK